MPTLTSLISLQPLEGPALLLFPHGTGSGTGSPHQVHSWDVIVESPAQLPSLGWRGASSPSS